MKTITLDDEQVAVVMAALEQSDKPSESSTLKKADHRKLLAWLRQLRRLGEWLAREVDWTDFEEKMGFEVPEDVQEIAGNIAWRIGESGSLDIYIDWLERNK